MHPVQRLEAAFDVISVPNATASDTQLRMRGDYEVLSAAMQVSGQW